MTSRNYLARRIPFSGTPAGTDFVGASDILPTDCPKLKHRWGGAFSWRSTTPKSTFAPKPRGSRHISRMRQTAVYARSRIQSVRLCDPACGSGWLLLRFAKIIGQENIDHGYFGQEINLTTYNLARINMFLHGVGFEDFSIALGDTLTDPKHWDDEPFETMVSKRWIARGIQTNDVRDCVLAI